MKPRCIDANLISQPLIEGTPLAVIAIVQVAAHETVHRQMELPKTRRYDPMPCALILSRPNGRISLVIVTVIPKAFFQTKNQQSALNSPFLPIKPPSA